MQGSREGLHPRRVHGHPDGSRRPLSNRIGDRGGCTREGRVVSGAEYAQETQDGGGDEAVLPRPLLQVGAGGEQRRGALGLVDGVDEGPQGAHGSARVNRVYRRNGCLRKMLSFLLCVVFSREP